jgi:hypothetical protein
MRGSAAACFLGLGGSNLAEGIDVSCVLSGRGLCVGLIARPEESYRVLSWRVDIEETLAW